MVDHLGEAVNDQKEGRLRRGLAQGVAETAQLVGVGALGQEMEASTRSGLGRGAETREVRAKYLRRSRVWSAVQLESLVESSIGRHSLSLGKDDRQALGIGRWVDSSPRGRWGRWWRA